MSSQYRFKCDALVDQGRHIGDDPVGYKCSNNCEYEDREGHLLCESCVVLKIKEPHRITWPEMFGSQWQIEALKSILNKLRKDP